MSSPHRAILAANLLIGPPVALFGPLVILAPVALICAFLGIPFPTPSQIISLIDILFALLGALGIAYAYGLIPAFLHSCVMLMAIRSGFSRAMLLLIAPVSGFLVTALFFSCIQFVLWREFPQVKSFAVGTVGILPAIVSTIVAFRWMGRAFRSK